MIGKAAVRKSNGALIEYQSGKPDAAVMMQNAVNAGINANDVEVRDLATQADLDALMPKITPRNWKAEYKALTSDPEKIQKIAEYLGLD